MVHRAIHIRVDPESCQPGPTARCRRRRSPPSGIRRSARVTVGFRTSASRATRSTANPVRSGLAQARRARSPRLPSERVAHGIRPSRSGPIQSSVARYRFAPVVDTHRRVGVRDRPVAGARLTDPAVGSAWPGQRRRRNPCRPPGRTPRRRQWSVVPLPPAFASFTA